MLTAMQVKAPKKQNHNSKKKHKPTILKRLIIKPRKHRIRKKKRSQK
jgi:hypothetical protein